LDGEALLRPFRVPPRCCKRWAGRDPSLVKGHSASNKNQAKGIRNTREVHKSLAQAALPLQGSGCQASY
jgi:hypothetical protein